MSNISIVLRPFFANFESSSWSSWRRQRHPTPVLLPGESPGWRSLVGCSPWGCEELDTTERLHFHFPLSCIGEGNGNPLQCSCLENPRDGGAWWAAVYGVAQGRTRLKRLSSSSMVLHPQRGVWFPSLPPLLSPPPLIPPHPPPHPPAGPLPLFGLHVLSVPPISSAAHSQDIPRPPLALHSIS